MGCTDLTQCIKYYGLHIVVQHRVLGEVEISKEIISVICLQATVFLFVQLKVQQCTNMIANLLRK